MFRREKIEDNRGLISKIRRGRVLVWVVVWDWNWINCTSDRDVGF